MSKMKMSFVFFLAPLALLANVRVVATLSDIADIAKQIGKEKVTVDYIVRGNMNPHFVEVKPSYMMKLKSADVFFQIGMDLELWAPQIIDGSRNSQLLVVDLSQRIPKLDVPQKFDASQGDVHRHGNPHYWLDPRNIRVIADEIVAALAKKDPASEKYFRANADEFVVRVEQKRKEWEDRMKPLRGKKIVTFHSSWSYFANWLGLTVAGYVEPKPGIQPSPTHTAELFRIVRENKIKAIVVEPFYDDSAPRQIASATGASVVRLATSVGGAEQAKDYISLIEYNVSTLAAALK